MTPSHERGSNTRLMHHTGAEFRRIVSVDMRTAVRAGMCTHLCIDVYTDMCVEMRVEMCMDTRAGTACRHEYGHGPAHR